MDWNWQVPEPTSNTPHRLSVRRNLTSPNVSSIGAPVRQPPVLHAVRRNPAGILAGDDGGPPQNSQVAGHRWITRFEQAGIARERIVGQPLRMVGIENAVPARPAARNRTHPLNSRPKSNVAVWRPVIPTLSAARTCRTTSGRGRPRPRPAIPRASGNRGRGRPRSVTENLGMHRLAANGGKWPCLWRQTAAKSSSVSTTSDRR